MSKVAIVTDSTAYIPDELRKQLNITVVPLILIWGNEAFQDGVDMLPEDFYKRMETSKVIPSTSQATIPSMKKAFEELLRKVMMYWEYSFLRNSLEQSNLPFKLVK